MRFLSTANFEYCGKLVRSTLDLTRCRGLDLAIKLFHLLQKPLKKTKYFNTSNEDTRTTHSFAVYFFRFLHLIISKFYRNKISFFLCNWLILIFRIVCLLTYIFQYSTENYIWIGFDDLDIMYACEVRFQFSHNLKYASFLHKLLKLKPKTFFCFLSINGAEKDNK